MRYDQRMNIAYIGITIALVAGLLLGYLGQRASSSPDLSEVAPDVSIPLSDDFLSLRPGISSLPTQEVSGEEKEGLLFMREEEKLARDVYETLYAKWSIPIFSNIAQSEQTHTEAVRALLEKYSMSDPVSDESLGAFINQDLAMLYTNLVNRGTTSAVDALAAGALIEDLDIADLQRYISQTDNEDIALVYENLMRGSRNHLRSFVMQLASRGVTYEPQYISQEEFDAIIATPRETGSGSGGRGWGRMRDQ